MGRPRCAWKAWSVCSIAVFLTTVSFAQTVAQNPRGSISATTLSLPLTECEGAANCSTWTFLGIQENGRWRIRGNGEWRTGEVASLFFESPDEIKLKDGGIALKIHRKDETGASAGLTAIYEATLHDGRLEGEFTSSGPGNGRSRSGKWYATAKDYASSHPKAMRMTLPGTPLYWSFTANSKGTYDAALSNSSAHDTPVSTAIMTLQQFDPDGVAMRIEGGGHLATANGKMYREMSGEASIVSGDWSSDLGQTGPFIATWGESLADIPMAQNVTFLGRPKLMYLSLPGTPLTWTFTAQDNGPYEAVLNNTSLNTEVGRGLMRLEVFNAYGRGDLDGEEAVKLEIDTGGHRATATAKISGQKNTAIGRWASDSGQTGGALITWGEALAAVPIMGLRPQPPADAASDDIIRRYFTFFRDLLSKN